MENKVEENIVMGIEEIWRIREVINKRTDIVNSHIRKEKIV